LVAPPAEIELMGLLRRFIRRDPPICIAAACARALRRTREDLDPDIRRLLDEAEGADQSTTAGWFWLSPSITGAAGDCARPPHGEGGGGGDLALNAVTADKLASYLDAPDVPDPDLIIRTSGEQRLSNFLLWQAAYSELVFVPAYWQDFDRAALEDAIIEYRRRESRFGGLVARTGS
jgi:undecaprenyl diphosphate synthase